ncbi:MAG TPA: ABC transporter substrate-binding protein [Kiloniellales bacterium]|nr:ABC transporter substrate-binding protein [Kiloniellales bacterium]
MNRALQRWLAAGALAAFAAASPAQAAVPESNDPIKLTLHDWTGQLITTTIMGEVLKSMGYTVEYLQADYLAQFAGLETGDLTIAMEMWQTTGQDALEASLATGNTVDLGETGMQAKEEWWYPLYMKERCPGLPNWEALKACGEAFSTPETAPKGRYLGGPVTWGGYDEERVEALGLPFEVVHAGTDAALFAEIQSAYERQAPIIAWVYAPHWATAKFEGEWIEFPVYERACYEDPAWGINKEKAYDCGKPFGWIKKVGWKGGEEKWPAAYNAVRKFQIDNATMSALIVKVDLEGMTVEEAVKEWMDANKATWEAWTK